MLRHLLVCLILLAAPAAAEPLRLLAFGDSLTAGYGLAPREAFPVQLEAALRARGHEVTVLNAGVSGDTASAAADRLAWALGENADAVIVELGGNDALRGQSPEATRQAMDAILAALAARQLPVLVAGMRAPPNLGAAYMARFDALFAELAQKHGALYYPFFLDGVAADARLNQADGIHPNAEGVAVIVARMLPKIEELLALAAKK